LDGVAIYSVEQLEPEAGRDQYTFRQQGVVSVIFVPLAVGGELTGFISCDSVNGLVDWSDDAVSLLRIVAGMVADALDRKRSEEALRRENYFTISLLNAAGAAIIVLDRSGQIVRFNPAAERVTGLTAEEAMGHTPWDIFVPREERAEARNAFRKVAQGAAASAQEGTVLTRGGMRRTLSWSTTSIVQADGAVEYVVMSGIDVTETKRLEAEVLNVAEREQSRFGHDLHDGLGQHLTGIEFMSHVLHERLVQEGRPEATDMAQIAQLIRDAITHARDLARGLSPVILQSKGLAAALHDLAESTTRHLRIECDALVESGIPLPAHEVATHLYRIAQEAVSNAVKHGRATSVQIVLRATEADLELLVTDNGVGFPDDYTGQTMGMGLRVMNYRAGIIAGNLSVSQHPGEGVTVSCTLDLSRVVGG
jgi:two-component system, LuxR family, sensor kinase FixL